MPLNSTFSTKYNFLLGDILKYDTVQSTKPTSWIFKKDIAQYLWRHESRASL